ncbi:hypothetical protein ACQ4PT_056061 [Festuca glaucescens]
MDLLCDDTVEEILLRLPDKRHLCCARAVARRYNTIIRRPGFGARHTRIHTPYRSFGIFLQNTCLHTTSATAQQAVHESLASFVSSSSSSSPVPALLSDLNTFLPIPSARELASLEHAGVGPGVTGRRISILHSSAGLLLCSRGHVSPVHYYVCDPLSRKFF